MALKTPERIQAAFLIASFAFILYATYVAVNYSVEQRNVRPASGPTDRLAPVRPGQEKPGAAAPAKKGPENPAALKHLDAAIQSHPKDPKNYVSRAELKASLGDCDGASKDYSKAATLDKSLQDQVPSELDACKQK